MFHPVCRIVLDLILRKITVGGNGRGTIMKTSLIAIPMAKALVIFENVWN